MSPNPVVLLAAERRRNSRAGSAWIIPDRWPEMRRTERVTMATIVSRRLWQKCSHPGRQGGGACREFTCSVMLFSGHNRWSTIRHDKAKNDKAKSKERQVVVKDLSSATQMWGPDPKYNPRLTLALTNAKRAEIPKSVIEAAMARGQGLSVTGQALDHLTIEAMLPSSVAAVIECETDQKGRTLQDVRRAIKDVEGNVTPTTYLFEKKGRVVFEGTNGLNVDDYLDLAIEAGAADLVTDEEGRLVIFTEPAETKRVGEAFSQLSGLVIQELEIIWDPNKDTLVDLDEKNARSLEDGLNYIREDPSVRDIYLNTAKKL